MAEPLAIHLLGPQPHVVKAGHLQPPPRGHKAWALLAYLLTTTSAPSREWLAELLFPEADDPLNALSWNLTQLRRLLGPDATIEGTPVVLRLPPGTFVDIHALTAGTWVQAINIPGLGRELLEGMVFPGCPGFEAWLLASRRHLAGAAEGVLREAARAKLSSGDAARAVQLASRLVATNPLDEDAQELLIRAYVTNGDQTAGEIQRDACVALFRRELGTDPGVAVLRAAEPEPQRRASPDRPATRTATMARLEAGLGALDAGAADAAISLLRQAVADAEEVDDWHLQVQTLMALGSALVHSVRGRDGEGAGVLHEAIAVADRIGYPESAALAHRELGYVDLLRGRYDRAQRWLQDATTLAGDEPSERAWAFAVQGVASTDVGRYSEALIAFREARRLAGPEPLTQVHAWVWTFTGRLHLLRNDLEQARECLTQGLESARALRWTAFVPLPEALLADVDLVEGNVEAASAAYEHAHALALQLGDPCWEGLGARGMGLVAAHRGDAATALQWVAEARHRCVRLPDAYLWVEGYCLDALCSLALDQQRAEASQWIHDMQALAARTGMRELVARAYAHQGKLGDQAAIDAARVLAAEVDNPDLRRLE
ncbi:MAG TPA: BTAD domain-containing putative transcriptional regulator [Lapillicoccus sp.]|nr:BTAD domain-containing putative transcriptional regulator [Lapillicoccus sp.]